MAAGLLLQITCDHEQLSRGEPDSGAAALDHRPLSLQRAHGRRSPSSSMRDHSGGARMSVPTAVRSADAWLGGAAGVLEGLRARVRLQRPAGHMRQPAAGRSVEMKMSRLAGPGRRETPGHRPLPRGGRRTVVRGTRSAHRQADAHPSPSGSAHRRPHSPTGRGNAADDPPRHRGHGASLPRSACVGARCLGITALRRLSARRLLGSARPDRQGDLVRPAPRRHTT